MHRYIYLPIYREKKNLKHKESTPKVPKVPPTPTPKGGKVKEAAKKLEKIGDISVTNPVSRFPLSYGIDMKLCIHFIFWNCSWKSKICDFHTAISID